MSVQQQAKYELLKEQKYLRNNHTWLRLGILISLCAACSFAVYAIWSMIYRQSLNVPPKFADIPESWKQRALTYNYYFYKKIENKEEDQHHLLSTTIEPSPFNVSGEETVRQLDNERIYPSKLGNFIYTPPDHTAAGTTTKLVCYYAAPKNTSKKQRFKDLYPSNIDAHLCTHINIGVVEVHDNRLLIDEQLNLLFHQTNDLKVKNPKLKVLLWVGGAGASSGFSEMIANHTNRKIFIQSLKSVLETYRLDGIDLDWEFPSAYKKERQHFSQLLHEIRREYEREHRTYLLSVAVAAAEGLIFFAYDIREINNYADYVNIMTYDYHFYTRGAPFTGLNAPLYPRNNEKSIFSTFNINYSVNYWNLHGLEKNKIVIGLPTYGHSYRLVNPFNNGIGSPALDIGQVGTDGFVPYSELCWFKQNNLYITSIFDVETCSPYLYAGLEWISYENEKSLECKTQYIKENGFGGAMIFSLNTDDYGSICENRNKPIAGDRSKEINNSSTFPLVRKIYSILFD